MRSTLWYVFTFGIPLLGVATCALGGALVYRRARSNRAGRVIAALSYLVATSLPVVLASMAMKFGSYLAFRHKSYVFFGEDTWLLFILTAGYFWLAVVCNLALWLVLVLMKAKSETRTA